MHNDRIWSSHNLRINLPYKVSTNSIYSGKHWRTRAKHKEEMLEVFKDIETQPFENQVDINMDFYLKGRTLDSSNCSYMFKIIEDCLVKCGYLIDDTSKYVRRVSMESHKADYNYVEIEFTERKVSD